jgi:hypothetical protein
VAISALSPVGGGYLQLYRSRPAGGPGEARRAAEGPGIAPVEATPALLGREDSKTAGESAKEAEDSRRLLALDPRRAGSLLGAEPSTREADSLMGELLGRKSAIERGLAERKGARTAEALSQLAQLKSRDAEVRFHEAAHVAAGGRYVTGGASYSYQKGPDGAQYAVGGEVGIDTSPVPGKPEETALKMRTVRAAALAPSEPSAADLSVAAAASQAEAEALAEIARARGEGPASRAGAAGEPAGAAAAYGEGAAAASGGGRGSPPLNPVDMLA